MGDLYLIEHATKIVFTYSYTADGIWEMSRMPSCQREKVKMFLQRGPKGWVLQDFSPGEKGAVFGFPATPLTEDPDRPPLGSWKVWGGAFTLSDAVPEPPPSLIPFSFEVPFATLSYTEEGSIGRVRVTMRSAPISDGDLEDMLDKVKGLLLNLARRPGMVVFFSSDARSAHIPAMRHVWRFTSFIKEFGSEFFLVGRGDAIICNPTGFMGTAILQIVKMVYRILPPPWPACIVRTVEQGEEFIEQLVTAYTETIACSREQATLDGRRAMPPLATFDGSPTVSPIHVQATVQDPATRQCARVASLLRGQCPPESSSITLLSPAQQSEDCTLAFPADEGLQGVGASNASNLPFQEEVVVDSAGVVKSCWLLCV
mmetsp:Transcript_16712/g.36628  ORF Transcript_16712/g.36628 Transcript_16712/m.36628 type:complete len:372 (+) Transcript_16712:49-1164(+)